jgi:ADP-ribosylglycohydrolase
LSKIQILKLIQLNKMETPENDTAYDRYLGMVVGHCLGDALGSPHEFVSKEYSGKLEIPIQHHSRFQGLRTSTIGQVSDDTEMTITLLNRLVSDRGYNGNNVVLSYMKWANSKCPFLGRNTRDLFLGVKEIREQIRDRRR